MRVTATGGAGRGVYTWRTPRSYPPTGTGALVTAVVLRAAAVVVVMMMRKMA